MNLTSECDLTVAQAWRALTYSNTQTRPPVTRPPLELLELLELLICANAAAQNPGEEHEDLAEQFTRIMADPATGEQLRALRAQAEAWAVVQAIADADPPIGRQEARMFAQKAIRLAQAAAGGEG